MKRILALALVAVLLMLAGCGGAKSETEDAAAVSQKTDDRMTSEEFNTLEGTNPALSANDSPVSSETAVDTDTTDVSAAFSAYQAALKVTQSQTVYRYTASQSYAMVINGASVVLERSAVEAESDGRNAACWKTTASKDAHNNQLSSLSEGLYADRSDGVCYTYSKYSDYVDTDNSSEHRQTENYAVQPLGNWIDGAFAFGKNDVASASVGEGGRYTFTLRSDRASKIVTDLLGSIGLEQSDEVSVSYFVVTARLTDGVVSSYSCSVICTIGSDGTSYKLSSGYEVAVPESGTASVARPDWVK